jgi:hypothetical protein
VKNRKSPMADATTSAVNLSDALVQPR